MFHCDGWTFTWGVTAAMATHVCLRKVDPKLIFPSIRDNGVTHMCGAPIVLNMLANAPADVVIKPGNPGRDRNRRCSASVSSYRSDGKYRF